MLSRVLLMRRTGVLMRCFTVSENEETAASTTTKKSHRKKRSSKEDANGVAAVTTPVPVFEFCETLKVKGTIGVGCWAWSYENKSAQWQHADESQLEQDCIDSYNASVDEGVTFFDTAEVYAQGQSEEVVGRALQRRPDDAVAIATKFLPMPSCLFASSLSAHLEASLARLAVPSVALYQVHGMLPSVRTVETWMGEMVKLVQAGKVQHVGVSNFTPGQVERAHRFLAKHNIPLVSNQIEYSLLRRAPETNGVIDMCNKLHIKIIAYSPLGMGRLSGKYGSANPPPAGRQFGNVDLKALDTFLDVIRGVAKEHGDDVTPSQIALAWVIHKGAFPISGARNAKQARENARAMHIKLTDEQVKALEDGSVPCQAQPAFFERLWQD
jgi:aryl-alcohol dehydrogenase-like predicted oxidoreductase